VVPQKKDVMKSIRSSLYYYENVAHSATDVERQVVIENSAAKLKNIIAHIEAELESKSQSASRVNLFVEAISSDRDYNRTTEKRLVKPVLYGRIPAN
jgi:hypothetical protein